MHSHPEVGRPDTLESAEGMTEQTTNHQLYAIRCQKLNRVMIAALRRITHPRRRMPETSRQVS